MRLRLRSGRLLMAVLMLPLLTGSATEVRRAQLAGEASFRLVMIPPGASSSSGVHVIEHEPLTEGHEGWRVYETGGLRVEWRESLEVETRVLAAHLDHVLSQEWAGAGIRPVQRPLLQLHEIKDWPSVVVVESRWAPPGESDWLPVALPVLPPGAPLSEELDGLYFPSEMIFLLAHELTEYALVTRERGTVLMDTAGPDGREEAYYTRWFREGMATVMAVRVCDRLGLAHAFTREKGRRAIGQVGSRLLFWTQGQNLDVETNRLYYDAAFELVSRMFDEAGPGEMEALIEDFGRHDYVDGLRLGDLTLEHLGKRPRGYLDGRTSAGAGNRDDGAGRRVD